MIEYWTNKGLANRGPNNPGPNAEQNWEAYQEGDDAIEEGDEEEDDDDGDDNNGEFEDIEINNNNT